MFNLKNVVVPQENKTETYVPQYNHAPLKDMGFIVKGHKTQYDEDARCDVYAAAGNYHFKTSMVDGEQELLAFETYEDALEYIDSVLVKYRVPGIWHVARRLEDNKFVVLPTYTGK